MVQPADDVGQLVRGVGEFLFRRKSGGCTEVDGYQTLKASPVGELSSAYIVVVHEGGGAVNKGEGAVAGLARRIPVHINEFILPEIESGSLFSGPGRVACANVHRKLHMGFLQQFILIPEGNIVALPVRAIGVGAMALQAHIAAVRDFTAGRRREKTQGFIWSSECAGGQQERCEKVPGDLHGLLFPQLCIGSSHENPETTLG